MTKEALWLEGGAVFLKGLLVLLDPKVSRRMTHSHLPWIEVCFCLFPSGP